MTKPFIRKDHLTHRAAVEAGYAPLSEYVREAPHAIPISHDVFLHFKEIADRENASVSVVINEELRRRMGDR